MLKGFTHARLACGCRITFREGVEGSPVTVVVDEKSPACTLSLHVRDLPVFDYREALRPSTRLGPPRRRRVRRRRLALGRSAIAVIVVIVETLLIPVTIHPDDRPAPPATCRACASIATPRRAGAGCRGLVLVVLAGRRRRRLSHRPARYLDEQRAPEVDVARATQVVATPRRLDRTCRCSSRPATWSRATAATSA